MPGNGAVQRASEPSEILRGEPPTTPGRSRVDPSPPGGNGRCRIADRAEVGTWRNQSAIYDPSPASRSFWLRLGGIAGQAGIEAAIELSQARTTPTAMLGVNVRNFGQIQTVTLPGDGAGEHELDGIPKQKFGLLSKPRRMWPVAMKAEAHVAIADPARLYAVASGLKVLLATRPRALLRST